MVRFDTPDGAAERFQQRQSWRAMQAAYRQYRQSSALVHSLADLSVDSTSSEKAIRLQIATRDQRAAFEGYIEARLQFLEASCDRNHHATQRGGPETKRFLWVVGPITMGLGALNILCLSWEHRQIAESNTIRRHTNENVSSAREGLQGFAEPVAPSLAASGIPDAGTRQVPPGSKRTRQPSAGPRRQIVRLVRARRYAYTDFAVATSPRFTRIGRVRLSLRSVDRRAHTINLCVASRTVTFCKNDVRPYEWLAIHLGGPIPTINLLVTRVGPNRIQGYFRALGNWAPLKVSSLQTH